MTRFCQKTKLTKSDHRNQTFFDEMKHFEIKVPNRDAHVKRLTSLNFSLFFVVSDYNSISLSRTIMIHRVFDCSNLGEHTTNLQRIDRVCRKVFRPLQRPPSSFKLKSKGSTEQQFTANNEGFALCRFRLRLHCVFFDLRFR